MARIVLLHWSQAGMELRLQRDHVKPDVQRGHGCHNHDGSCLLLALVRAELDEHGTKMCHVDDDAS